MEDFLSELHQDDLLLQISSGHIYRPVKHDPMRVNAVKRFTCLFAVKFLDDSDYKSCHTVLLEFRFYGDLSCHQNTRIKEGIYNINPDEEPLRSELLNGKFTVLVSAFFLLVLVVFTCMCASMHPMCLLNTLYTLDVSN